MARPVDCDFNWHDGVLADLQSEKLCSGQPELRLTVDLYPDADRKSKRKRFPCAGKSLSRPFVKSDVPRLVKNSGSGNIDVMRMDFTADTEIVVPPLLGGLIEAEKKAFTLAELKS